MFPCSISVLIEMTVTIPCKPRLRWLVIHIFKAVYLIYNNNCKFTNLSFVQYHQPYRGTCWPPTIHVPRPDSEIIIRTSTWSLAYVFPFIAPEFGITVVAGSTSLLTYWPLFVLGFICGAIYLTSQLCAWLHLRGNILDQPATADEAILSLNVEFIEKSSNIQAHQAVQETLDKS